MKLKQKILIIFALLVLSQPFVVNALGKNENLTIIDNTVEQSQPNLAPPIIADGAGGEEYLKSNVIPDGGFEESNSEDGPEYFYYGGSGTQIINCSYQDEVYAGSYAASARVKGTSQYNTAGSISQSTYGSIAYPKLDEKMYLTFRYNPKANPDLLNGGSIYAYVRLWTGTNNRYMYYYFSFNGGLSGNSTNAYFDLRDSLDTWYLFDRNITKDYEDAIGPVPSNLEVRTVYFRAYSPEAPTDFTQIIVDDVSFTNSTPYEFIQNGNFEAGDSSSWYDQKQGPSSAIITDSDYTEGTNSLELTSSALFDGASSNVYCERSLYTGYNGYPKSYYVTQPEDVTLSFDWKYTDTEGGGTNQYSRMYLYGYNGTFSYSFYFMFGDDDDTIDDSNSTSSSGITRYYELDGFGVRDTWHTFSIDFYDIFLAEDILNVPFSHIGFHAYAGYSANSTTKLNVDNLNFIANPTGDPSFEQDWAWSATDPFVAWNGYNDVFTNITSDAHTGNLAANVSSHSSAGQCSISRDTYIQGNGNLYCDFWWKLVEITSHANTYSYIRIELNFGTNTLYYLLGTDGGSSFTNSTSVAWIKVENFNETGSWYNLVRDITYDAYDAFGIENIVVTDIQLVCYANQAGAVVTTIFDDINFVRDTTPPAITDPVLLSIPTYEEEGIIEVTVTDVLHEVNEVILHYNNDSTWYAIPAEKIEESLYRAILPQSPYATTYEFYIEAFDTAGNSIVNNNSGTYYSYTVIDDIDPVLNVFGPTEGSEIKEEVTFYLYGDDAGSGLEELFVTIGDTSFYDNDSIYETYTLDTTNYANGEFSITFTANDVAGNSVELTKSYTIANTAPALIALGNLFNYGTLVGAGVVALGFGIFFLVRFIKMRKVS